MDILIACLKMKKYLFLPFAIVCLATGAAAGTSAGTSVGATVGATANPATSTDDSITKIAPLREIVNINRDWKFFSNTETDSDGATTVNLPHTWNHDALGGNKNYFRGIGNYMKEIEIPYRWQGRRVFIRCHGANSIANIMVNGKHAGEHRGGYTAFALEITERLRFGEKNHLWIMVNNSPQTDLLPTAGDQNSYGGLFRDVELIVTGAEAVVPTDKGSEGIYIKQRDITRERAEAEATVKIGGTGDANLTALLTVISAEGDTVARREARVRLHGRAISTVTIPFSVDKPRLWNGMADPYLYRIGIELRKGDATCDRIFTTTGFRWVSVEPGGAFVLNGEPYPVRGVVVTQDRSMVGTAITRGQVREDIELIREMGANAVRVLGVSHHPEFYDLCDSYGLLVWNDFPLVGAAHLTDKAFFDTESFRRNGEQQAGEIMARLYNHPSVVIWGLFSNPSTCAATTLRIMCAALTSPPNAKTPRGSRRLRATRTAK